MKKAEAPRPGAGALSVKALGLSLLSQSLLGWNCCNLFLTELLAMLVSWRRASGLREIFLERQESSHNSDN